MAESGSKFGLVDSSLLEKIDKLFACNAGSYVDLPQLVVVGNQSSGKSSVLAALTDLPFPRDSGLCTRFATQIIFRRAPESVTKVSIIPSKDSSSEHQRQMQEWFRETSKDFDVAYFAGIMNEAAEAMGLGQAKGGPSRAFSKDVFVIEITGPNQEHFSIIDVPGTFRRTTDGVTTKDDIALVDNMVHGYMANPRSVMLTVIPCNVDIANQDIIEKAQDLDPEGNRTFGVLTKPDLMDRGSEGAVVDLVEGKHHKLKLGWHVLRNPGQATLESESKSRSQVEASFFETEAPWNALSKDNVGILALKTRLQEILATHIRREFPRVKADLSDRLRQAKKQYSVLGPKRQSEMEQRQFITEIAIEFQRIVSMGLRAEYGRSSFFDEDKSLRLATVVTTRGQDFADQMATFGHEIEFDEANEDESESSEAGSTQSHVCTRQVEAHHDIEDMLPESSDLSLPEDEGITAWLKNVYMDHKGFEIATLPSGLLSSTMRRQASRWELLANGYVSDIATLVYRFVDELIDFTALGNRKVSEMIKSLCSDSFRETYESAARHTAFLLEQELQGVPATYSSRFEEGLTERRAERSQAEAAEKAAKYQDPDNNSSLSAILALPSAISSADRRVQDIHDILYTYYEVALDRFVDNIRMQVADNFLVTGKKSPLTFFSPAFVAGLTKEQLEDIAGEEVSVKRQRAELEREMQRLEEGKKILR